MTNGPLGQFREFLFSDYVHKATDNPQFVARIRQEQADDLARMIPPMAMASATGALMTTFVMMAPGRVLDLLLWFGAFLALSVYVRGGRTVRKTFGIKREKRTAHQRLALLSVQIMCAGALWCVAPILFYPGSSPEQQMIMTLVVAGVMGTGAIAMKAMPNLAGAFSALVSIGLIIGVGMESASVSLAAVLLVAFYFTSVMHSVNETGRIFVDRLVKQFEIEKSKELFTMLFRDFEDSTSDWMWEINHDMSISHVSPQFFKDERTRGFPLHGRSIRYTLKDPNVPEHKRANARMPRALTEALAHRRPFRDVVAAVMIGNKWRYWKISGRPVYAPDGSFQGMRGACSDITESHSASNRLEFLAMHDALTGLPNRENFGGVLNHALETYRRSGTGFALMAMDLDKFKMVNDTLGHQAGDEVLACVARRLERFTGETVTVSRFGGDEFCLLVVGEGAERRARVMAGSILDAIAVPMEITSGKVEIGCSIGVALAPGDGVNQEALHRNADLALYRAKGEARSAFRFFEPAMDAVARKQQELEYELRSALRKNEFELYFQPLADARTGKIVCHETLLRWNSEKFGRVPPDEFIRIAEKSGLIEEIGEWVIRHACMEAAKWPDGCRVAVNLSPRQMEGFRILDVVASALSDSRLIPSRLELEVTESVLETDPEHAAGLLRSIRALGSRISLDDFGTGYSSLSYLVRFPIDKLKIDRSFVQGAESSTQNLAIIRAIVSLARTMNVKITAEGVETAEQAAMLRDEGIDELQGYLISRPRPAAHVNAEQVTEEGANTAKKKTVLRLVS
ncbi:MAG: EAL domain-containing protein [Notoacmeibacter sp.]|nr:EAL domain-containing protein [Notoacmeibacter sp.]